MQAGVNNPKALSDVGTSLIFVTWWIINDYHEEDRTNLQRIRSTWESLLLVNYWMYVMTLQRTGYRDLQIYATIFDFSFLSSSIYGIFLITEGTNTGTKLYVTIDSIVEVSKTFTFTFILSIFHRRNVEAWCQCNHHNYCFSEPSDQTLCGWFCFQYQLLQSNQCLKRFSSVL